jgi:hypothetical protein
MSTAERDEATATDANARGASASIGALVAVVGPELTALPRRLPRVVRVAELTLTQFVQPVLLPARQLKIPGTLVGVDVDWIARTRVRRTIRFRTVATEQALEKTHRR